MKNTFIIRLIIFLIINFAALGIGAILQYEGPMGEWYNELEKAPWTPPGWVFGATWTIIMICYSIYLAFQFKMLKSNLIALFSVQFILNVSWNPIFFHLHEMLFALIIISSLTLVLGYYLIGFSHSMKLKSLLVLPYFVWLCIATSLNAYSFIYN